MDRRTKARIGLRLRCRVDVGTKASDNSGETTENISRNGLLLRWTRRAPVPQAGSPLCVEVELPSDGAFTPRLIRCDATVIRVIPGDDGASRVGLKVNTMRFVEAPVKQWRGDLNAATPVQEFVN